VTRSHGIVVGQQALAGPITHGRVPAVGLLCPADDLLGLFSATYRRRRREWIQPVFDVGGGAVDVGARSAHP